MRLLIALLTLAFTLHAATAVSFDPPDTLEQWEEQKAFFEKHGYLWIKHYFCENRTTDLQKWSDDLQQETLRLIANGTTDDTIIVVAEASDPSQVCRTEDFLHFLPELELYFKEALEDFISDLIDEPYALFKDKLNFKWPGGGAFSPHQDFPAYQLFAPRIHINAMVCIDPATYENGCLYVASNWKPNREILPYVVGGAQHGSIEPEIHKRFEWAPLLTDAGDLVLFTSYIPHYSEKNESDHPRRAMFITYNRLMEGEFRRAYYHAKRKDPLNPIFHIGTPTKSRSQD